MLKRFMDIVKDEEGATMAEYALLLALIAVVVIAGATILGNAISDKYEGVAEQISAAPGEE